MSLADGPQLASVHARTADVFADADARTRERLNLLVKLGGKCRGCGAGVSDAHITLHPGVCATCFRNKKLRPDPELLEKLAQTSAVPPPPPLAAVKYFTPATPHPDPEKHAHPPAHVAPASPAVPTETRMACPECKSPSRHKADCPKNPEKRPAAPPAAKPPSKPAAKPRAVPVARRGALSSLTVADLLARRAELRDDLQAVQAELAARAEKLEAERKAVLEAIADAA
jgi:hypothetical protein